MKLGWLCLMLMLVSSIAFAKPLRTVVWSQVERDGQLLAGRLTGSDPALGGEVLVVSNGGSKARKIEILVLDAPGLEELTWNLSGRVRYENISGKGYFELLNTLPSGSYFTKTLAEQGPMGALKGTSAARDFVLPFNAENGGAPASRLSLRVMLPPGSTVELGPLTLSHGLQPTSAPDGAWWTDAQAGWIGGIAGSLLGLLGALLGWLVHGNRARRFVSAVVVAAIGLGAVSLVSGIVALLLGQPYAVYYPLALIGMLSLLVFGLGRRRILRLYEDHELRKMRALDVAP